MENQEVKEVMWLKDLLPSCVPNARIATFSYASDWFTYKKGVKTSLRALGEQLLNSVELDRQNSTVRSCKTAICVLSIGLTVSRLRVGQLSLLAIAWKGWLLNRLVLQRIKQ